MATPRTPSVARSHDAGQGHHPRNPLARFQHGFEMRFEKVRAGYHRYLDLRDGAPRAVSRPAFWASSLLSLVPGAVPGREFLSRGGCGRDQPACARADGHADRGNRGPVRPCREAHPPGHPARRAGLHRGQYRPAGQRHQPRLSQHRRRRAGGWRHPDQPQ